MEIVVIYKQDGTLQCQPDIRPRPLDHDEALLKQHGVREICASRNVPGPDLVPACCGCPTGQVNAFAISAQDWQELRDGIVGTLGFDLWVGAPFPALGWDEGCTIEPEPLPPAARATPGNAPVLVRELIGRLCRCYRRGSALTLDFRPERVNIEKDDDERIVRIWFG